MPEGQSKVIFSINAESVECLRRGRGDCAIQPEAKHMSLERGARVLWRHVWHRSSGASYRGPALLSFLRFPLFCQVTSVFFSKKNHLRANLKFQGSEGRKKRAVEGFLTYRV